MSATRLPSPYRLRAFAPLALLVAASLAACDEDGTQQSGYPQIRLSEETLDFGAVKKDALATKSTVLSNVALPTLHLSARLSEDSSPAFSVIKVPETIEGGAEGTLELGFKPTGPGDARGTVIITSDDLENPERKIELRGSMVPPKACGDGKDNDGDGKVDYPADPACKSEDGEDEREHPCAFNPSTGADSQEPNNARSSPNPTVTTPSNNTTVYTYDLTLPAGDEDWIRLNIPSVGSDTNAKAEITCVNWGAEGCGTPPTAGLYLYYQDNVSGEQQDGFSDGKSGLATVQNGGSISMFFPSQRWLVGAVPTSTVCNGEAVNATLKITVVNK